MTDITDLADRSAAADEITRPLAEALQQPVPFRAADSRLDLYPEILHRSDEWYEARRGIITASVIGRLITPKELGLADNDISRGLTALLAAERITGFVD